MSQQPAHPDPALRASAANQAELRGMIVASLETAEHRATQIAHQLQQTRAHQRRLQAEQHAAREICRPVHNSTWWDHATPHDVAEIVQAAATWAWTDLAALYTLATVTDELEERTGINIDSLVAHAPQPVPTPTTQSPDWPTNEHP